MLVQFSFGNFRSFKETVTLSMVAAEALNVSDELNTANVFTARAKPRLELLRVAALYGANASGKSNVGRALQFFVEYVVKSANVGSLFPFMHFFLSTDNLHTPIHFEIIFIKSTTQFRYGFEVGRSLADNLTYEIKAEWLFQARGASETLLFERQGDIIKRGKKFSEGTALIKDGRIRRKESLFLSLSAQLGEEITSSIMFFLLSGTKVISGLDDTFLQNYTEECLTNNLYQDSILALIRESDTGIPAISLAKEETGEEIDLDLLTKLTEMTGEEANFIKRSLTKGFKVSAIHPVFDKYGKEISTIRFPFYTVESEGTKKLFGLAGMTFNTLHNGNTLFVDEMDARFHPLLTQAIIGLFQSPETNPKNAQLIFVTHDTNLLNPRKLRRDQIWFVEKDRLGASHLYSLADIADVGENDAFEADYFQGRYGAIPFLGGLKRVLADGNGTA